MARIATTIKSAINQAAGIGKSTDKEAAGKRVWEVALISLGGFVLAGAEIFSGYMPFGVAFYAATDKKGKNILLLLSVLLGYILFSAEFIFGLKYLLTILVLFIFKKRVGRHRLLQGNEYVMPLASGIALLGIGSGAVFAHGFMAYDIMLLFNEVALCCGGAYILSFAVPRLKNIRFDTEFTPKEYIACLIFVALAFLGLSKLQLGDFSIGRALGCLTILLVSRTGNIALSSMTGAAIGLAVSLGRPEAIVLCVGYGIAGMIAAAVTSAGKFFCSASFLIVNGILILYFSPVPAAAIWMYEIMAASILLLFIPFRPNNVKIGVTAYTDRDRGVEQKIRQQAALRVRRISEGIKEAYETVLFVSDKLRHTNFSDSTIIFEQAAENVCKRCAKGMYCWGREYDITMDRLSELLPILYKEGEIATSDFNPELLSSCTKAEKLAENINRAYEKYLARRRLNRQKSVYAKLECEQLIEMAKELEGAAGDLEDGLAFDLEGKQKVEGLLKDMGVEGTDVSVLCNEEIGINIEIFTEELSPVLVENPDFTDKLAELIGVDTLTAEVCERNDGFIISFTPVEELSASFAKADVCCDNEQYSGDSAACFKAPGGRLVACICDGMGSGKRAAIDSNLAVKVLEKVIKGGFKSETAMKILNSAMLLSCPDERIITADIAQINLYSGKCELLKAGAAPGYVRRRGCVYRVDSHSIPAGILEKTDCEISKMLLSGGDLVVMMSDGVMSSGSDAFMKKIIGEFKSGDDPQDLCDAILKAAKGDENTAEDDMTVIAISLS